MNFLAFSFMARCRVVNMNSVHSEKYWGVLVVCPFSPSPDKRKWRHDDQAWRGLCYDETKLNKLNEAKTREHEILI